MTKKFACQKGKGMEGLMEVSEEIVKEYADDDVRDAALISAAQRVEHYETAGYGCAPTYARFVGDNGAKDLLGAALDEESTTDKKLTEVAMSVVNIKAAN